MDIGPRIELMETWREAENLDSLISDEVYLYTNGLQIALRDIDDRIDDDVALIFNYFKD